MSEASPFHGRGYGNQRNQGLDVRQGTSGARAEFSPEGIRATTRVDESPREPILGDADSTTSRVCRQVDASLRPLRYASLRPWSKCVVNTESWHRPTRHHSLVFASGLKAPSATTLRNLYGPCERLVKRWEGFAEGTARRAGAPSLTCQAVAEWRAARRPT